MRRISRLTPPKPRKPAPSKASVDPPSGTLPATASVDEDQLNTPSAAFPWVVNSHTPLVGSRPGAVEVSIPVPITESVPPKKLNDELARLKVKPPTCHRGFVAVEGLKIQGVVKVTGEPFATLLKDPDVEVTIGATQLSTRVAPAVPLPLGIGLPRASPSTTPLPGALALVPMLMEPVIAAACAVEARAMTERVTASVVVSFIVFFVNLR